MYIVTNRFQIAKICKHKINNSRLKVVSTRHTVTNCEVSFFRRIFIDGYNKFIMVAVFLSRLPSTDAFDHFLVGDVELLPRIEKSGHITAALE